MINNIIILILSFFAIEAAKGETLIQSEKVSSLEYGAFLKLNPKYSPVIDSLLEKRTYEISSSTLTKLFDDAERAFLSEPTEVAHDKYKQIVTIALKSDWTESERKIIFHSMLRAAQTSINPLKRKQFLIQSKQLDSSLRPDENLFPPPLVKEWDAMQTKDIFKIVDIKKSPEYTVALLNGKKVELKRFAVIVPRGNFRLTLFSNLYAPYTKVLDHEKIKTLIPSSPLLAEGSCEKPKFHESVPQNSVALYQNDCVSNLNIKSNNSANRLSLKSYSNPASIQNRIELNTNYDSPKFYKSGVFWSAMAVAAAYIIYKEHDKDREEKETPTHTSGF